MNVAIWFFFFFVKTEICSQSQSAVIDKLGVSFIRILLFHTPHLRARDLCLSLAPEGVDLVSRFIAPL